MKKSGRIRKSVRRKSVRRINMKGGSAPESSREVDTPLGVMGWREALALGHLWSTAEAKKRLSAEEFQEFLGARSAFLNDEDYYWSDGGFYIAFDQNRGVSEELWPRKLTEPEIKLAEDEAETRPPSQNSLMLKKYLEEEKIEGEALVRWVKGVRTPYRFSPPPQKQ